MAKSCNNNDPMTRMKESIAKQIVRAGTALIAQADEIAESNFYYACGGMKITIV